MKLVVIELEGMGIATSIDLEEVYALEPDCDTGDQTVQLIAYRKSNSEDYFYLVDLDLKQDENVTYSEAVTAVIKIFRIMTDFWANTSKSSCFITDTSIAEYREKLRSSAF